MKSPIVEDVQPPQVPQEAGIFLTWLRKAKQWSFLNYLQILNTFAMLAIVQACMHIEDSHLPNFFEFSSYYGVVWNIYASLQERPFIDLTVTLSKCPQNYETISFKPYIGVKSSTEYFSRVTHNKFMDHHWCGKRITNYTFNSHQMDCPIGHMRCDSGYCVGIDEMCPLTQINVSRNPLQITLSRDDNHRPIIGIELHTMKHPCSIVKEKPVFENGFLNKDDLGCLRLGDQFLEWIVEDDNQLLQHANTPEEDKIANLGADRAHLFARHAVDIAQNLQCYHKTKQRLKKYLLGMSEIREWHKTKGDEFDKLLSVFWIISVFSRVFQIFRKVPFTAPKAIVVQVIFGLSIFPTLAVLLFMERTISDIEVQLHEFREIKYCFGAISWEELMKIPDTDFFHAIADTNQYRLCKIYVSIALMAITHIVARVNRRR